LFSSLNSHLSPFCREGKFELSQVSGQPSFYNIQMKLKVLNVTEEDLGTFRCLAKNSQGETSGEINLYGQL
jgi:hypothetical protein